MIRNLNRPFTLSMMGNHFKKWDVITVDGKHSCIVLKVKENCGVYDLTMQAESTSKYWIVIFLANVWLRIIWFFR